MFCHPCGTRGSVAAGGPCRLQWIWVCRQLWAQKDLPGRLGGSYRRVWRLAGSPVECVRWEGTQPSPRWECTHQSLHAHLHPALLQASHRSQTLFLPCSLPAHPSDTKQRHLPAACPIGAGRTAGQSPQDRAQSVLLPPPGEEGSSSPPLTCSLSMHCGSWHRPGPLRAWPWWGWGARHDTTLRVPSMRTTEGTRFIPGSWHRRQADTQCWASSEVVWECRLGMRALQTPTAPRQEHPSPFTQGGTGHLRGFAVPGAVLLFSPSWGHPCRLCIPRGPLRLQPWICSAAFGAAAPSGTGGHGAQPYLGAAATGKG